MIEYTTQAMKNLLATASEQTHAIRADIANHGFDWNKLQEYFPFNDALRPGDLDLIIAESLQSIDDPQERSDLLAYLDLQYVVLLEQAALREKYAKRYGRETNPPTHVEHIWEYLLLNQELRRVFESGNNISVEKTLKNAGTSELWKKIFG